MYSYDIKILKVTQTKNDICLKFLLQLIKTVYFFELNLEIAVYNID